MNGYDPGLGRLAAADSRDMSYRLRSIMPEDNAPLAESRYYNIHRNAPLNQGGTSSCVGHALHHFLMAAPLVTRDGPDPLYIYRQAQKVDEWEGEEPLYLGTSVRAGLKVLQDMGYIQEYRWTWNAEEVRRWVLGGHGTVVLGTNWYSAMLTPDRRGFIKPEGRCLGGHAYLVIGARESHGVRLLNSWGASWASRGRAWLSWEHLDQLLKENGEAVAPIETKVTVVSGAASVLL